MNVPLVSFGSGKPVLTVQTCLHGDETAGLMICSRLMKPLRKCQLNGTVRFVIAANPLAQAARSRVNQLDFEDMNRQGQGDHHGKLAARLAAILFETLKTSDFVIDLHEYDLITPAMALYIPGGSHEVNRTALEGIACFQPEFVWSVKEDHSSLIAALAGAGVPGFGVETTQADLLSPADLQAVVQALLRVIDYLGILEGKMGEIKPVKAFLREAVRSDQSGIWEPLMEPLVELTKGQVVGKFSPLPLLEEQTITSPGDGVLLQVAWSKLVFTGTELFALGKLDKELTIELEEACRRVTNN